MDLHFLGTGAGRPTLARNVSAIAMDLLPETGSCWLFDCGEGTQHQLLRSRLKMGKFNKLFVTHLHGDHSFGIPGFLSSRSYQGGTAPFTVYGPPGIRSFIEHALVLSGTHPIYELEIVEAADGVIYEQDGWRVEVLKLDHRIESLGYRITEPDPPRRVDTEKLAARGISPGPVYGKLQKGDDVLLDNGDWLKAADYTCESRPGRVVAILGDTRYCPAAVELASKADVLVHEATFAEKHLELAVDYGHSTAIQAASVAAEAGVRQLVLSHFSSRYQKEMQVLLDEAKTVFAETMLAEDFMRVPIKRRAAGL
jgi:ribonuclease Z